jgi:hypothetical protein
MKIIKVQDATYEILVKLSRKLKLTPEATADKIITENQR